MNGDLSLYFHIPFCKKKCPYCHFYVTADREDHKALLLDALLQEIEMRREQMHNHQLVSIYFGGGTPTLFGIKPIASILKQLPKAPEITIEANPEDVTLELMKGYSDAGINRVSIGVQSLQDDSLLTLGRGHSANRAIEAIEMTYAAGIDNISIDLMYELPDQTPAHFKKTLTQLKDLPISHLSLYNLTIEPHTPFSKRKLNLPSQTEGLEMLQTAVETLESIGLKRYEISAFAKPGRSSIHNTGYWKGRPFFGFGPSAFSYYQGRRFRNVCNLRQYASTIHQGEFPIDFDEKLPYPSNVRELLAVRLRMLDGLFIEEYQLDETTLNSLKRLEKQGLLQTRADRRLVLSEQGLLFYDSVAAEII